MANQKARKPIDNTRVILNKTHLSLFTASLRRLFPSFIRGIWPFCGLVIVKNKLRSVFYASVLLLMISFVITLSKFTAKPLACGSWFHSNFDNVKTQFIINKRTDAQKKNDVNLLNWNSTVTCTCRWRSARAKQVRDTQMFYLLGRWQEKM